MPTVAERRAAAKARNAALLAELGVSVNTTDMGFMGSAPAGATPLSKRVPGAKSHKKTNPRPKNKDAKKKKGTRVSRRIRARQGDEEGGVKGELAPPEPQRLNPFNRNQGERSGRLVPDSLEATMHAADTIEARDAAFEFLNELTSDISGPFPPLPVYTDAADSEALRLGSGSGREMKDSDGKVLGEDGSYPTRAFKLSDMWRTTDSAVEELTSATGNGTVALVSGSKADKKAEVDGVATEEGLFPTPMGSVDPTAASMVLSPDEDLPMRETAPAPVVATAAPLTGYESLSTEKRTRLEEAFPGVIFRGKGSVSTREIDGYNISTDPYFAASAREAVHAWPREHAAGIAPGLSQPLFPIFHKDNYATASPSTLPTEGLDFATECAPSLWWRVGSSRAVCATMHSTTEQLLTLIGSNKGELTLWNHTPIPELTTTQMKYVYGDLEDEPEDLSNSSVTFRVHSRVVAGVELFPALPTQAFTGSSDGTIKVVDLNSGVCSPVWWTPRKTIKGYPIITATASISQHPGVVFAGLASGGVAMVDTRSGSPFAAMFNDSYEKDRVFKLAGTAASGIPLMASATREGGVRVFDVRKMDKAVWELRPETGSPGSPLDAVTYTRDTLVNWEPNSTPSVVSSDVCGLDFSPSGNRLAVTMKSDEVGVSEILGGSASGDFGSTRFFRSFTNTGQWVSDPTAKWVSESTLSWGHIHPRGMAFADVSGAFTENMADARVTSRTITWDSSWLTAIPAITAPHPTMVGTQAMISGATRVSMLTHSPGSSIHEKAVVSDPLVHDALYNHL